MYNFQKDMPLDEKIIIQEIYEQFFNTDKVKKYYDIYEWCAYME